jgi:regulatory protein
MKITKLERQKNNKSRINVYLNDVFWKAVEEETVVAKKLFEGKDLDAVYIDDIISTDGVKRCLNRSFIILAQRLQSEKELRDKLAKTFTFDIVDQTLVRLKELNYVDDVKFAYAWVRDRGLRHSRKQLEFEMYQKGISKETQQIVISECDATTELNAARRLAFAKKIDSCPPELRYAKIGGYLSRKGFSYDIIKQVLNENKKIL